MSHHRRDRRRRLASYAGPADVVVGVIVLAIIVAAVHVLFGVG